MDEKLNKLHFVLREPLEALTSECHLIGILSLMGREFILWHPSTNQAAFLFSLLTAPGKEPSMAKKYFAWKNASCNGENIEWVEMTGKEFLMLKRNPENKNRKFIRLGYPNGEEDCIYIEATKEQYDDWHRKQSVEDRLENLKKELGISEVQLSVYAEYIEDCRLSSADKTLDVEEEVISRIETEELLSVLKQLQPDELEIVNALFFNNPDSQSERTIAQALTIPRKTLNNRKRKIFEKIKKYLAQN